MSRRKGELSKYMIDLEWPHQVAIRADLCAGHNYRTRHYYIASEKLSLRPRGHYFSRDAVTSLVMASASTSSASPNEHAGMQPVHASAEAGTRPRGSDPVSAALPVRRRRVSVVADHPVG
jgi:hypothetical protein